MFLMIARIAIGLLAFAGAVLLLSALAMAGDLPSAKAKPFTLHPFLRTNCPPCERWKQIGRPEVLKLADVGLSNESVALDSMPAPMFYLVRSGRAVAIRGFADVKQHLSAIASAKKSLLAGGGFEIQQAEVCYRSRNLRTPLYRAPIRAFIYRLFSPRGWANQQRASPRMYPQQGYQPPQNQYQRNYFEAGIY